MNGGINRCAALHFLYALTSPDIVSHQATKKGNSDGSMGSKSKTNLMKSYENIKNEAVLKLKKQKRENALDIKCKSFKKNINVNCSKGSGSLLINL